MLGHYPLPKTGWKYGWKWKNLSKIDARTGIMAGDGTFSPKSMAGVERSPPNANTSAGDSTASGVARRQVEYRMGRVRNRRRGCE